MFASKINYGALDRFEKDYQQASVTRRIDVKCSVVSRLCLLFHTTGSAFNLYNGDREKTTTSLGNRHLSRFTR